MARTSLVLVSILAALLGAAGCKKEGAELPPASGEGAPPPPKVPTITTGPRDAAAHDGHTTGTTFPAAEANVGPMIGGTILAIEVVEGQRVKKGDVLFRLDARDAALRVRQAEVALAQARVAERAARTEHDRTKVLVDQGAQNRAAWDAIVARYDGARVGVDQAQVMLSIARKASADAVVRAPIDGLITAKLKNAGELATTMPPTVVVVVQDQRTLELKFRLPELALRGVVAGMPIRADFTAVGVSRDAVVQRVMPSVDARTRTVELVAVLDNADGALRPGLLAEVTVKAPTTAPTTARTP